MASAAQLAWRKKFAAMAKAGTLPKSRKSAKRKKNPLGLITIPGVPNGFVGRARRKNPVPAPAAQSVMKTRMLNGRKRNPSGRSSADLPSALEPDDDLYSNPRGRKRNPSGRSGKDQASTMYGEDDLMNNPKRRRNPAAHRAPSGFQVHTVAYGQPAKLLGIFPEKAKAVEYARAYAESHKCQVGITGRK